ncbi:MAG TPA: YggS family pyridoxal phosphate-dependent enzyme [Steroidobacteraceae bacterium]|nr:YggS family pyridoxal phosphate-dependent enzyme [Steroidobacteraceae bacterium]
MIRTPQNSAPDATSSASLATNLAGLRQRIDAAATRAGRDVHSVTLLAVSKGQSAARIREALELGLTAFGENYLDEALPKIEALAGTPATWHFIGRLQANKTRPVATHFHWVHGIDRARIAERLSAQRPHFAPPLDVCLQVRVAEDPGKAGVEPAQCLALAREVAALPRLRLRGLMCMLPFEAAPGEQHAGFARLRALADTLRAAGLPLDTLSMGMSADMDAAIAEGATIVRIGTALFGPRPHVESPA